MRVMFVLTVLGDEERWMSEFGTVELSSAGDEDGKNGIERQEVRCGSSDKSVGNHHSVDGDIHCKESSWYDACGSGGEGEIVTWFMDR